MSTNPKAPGFTILAGIGLSVLILLAWVGQLATLSDLSGSDPAGNALAQAFGALEIIVLWGLLAVLALRDAASSRSGDRHPNSRVGFCRDDCGGALGRTRCCAVHVAYHHSGPGSSAHRHVLLLGVATFDARYRTRGHRYWDRLRRDLRPLPLNFADGSDSGLGHRTRSGPAHQMGGRFHQAAGQFAALGVDAIPRDPG